MDRLFKIVLNRFLHFGYGLEILVIYRFLCAERLVKWLDKKISAVKNELMYQTAKCLKLKNI